MPTPSILLVTRVFPPKTGGIERLMYELHSRLHPKFDVSVVAPAFAGSHAFDRQAGVRPVRRSLFVGSRFKLSYAPLFAVALATARRTRADLLVCDQVETGMIGLVIRRLYGVPYVVFAHGAELYDRGSKHLKRSVYRGADLIVANSADTAARVREFSRACPIAVQVVHPGTDVQRFRGGDPEHIRNTFGLHGKRVILTVSRIAKRDRYKGHDVVIRALPRVLDYVPDATYLVVGEGDDQQRLERIARDLGVASHVTFGGRISDRLLPGVYAASDVFVMVSREAHGGRTEGFGIVYLEAAAAGKPVVFAASGGAGEAAVDGVTGLQADPDDVSAVVAAIVRLLTNPVEAQRMGENGQRRVEQCFSWEHAAGRYRGLLDAVLTRRTQS